MTVTLLHDDTRKVNAFLHRKRIRIDPAFGGELSHLFEDERARRAYYGRNGMGVDEAGEAMWDAGLLLERPTSREILDLFAEMMQTSAQPARVSGVDWEDLEAKRESRRKNRWRTYRCYCPRYGTIRVACDNFEATCHKCGERFELKTVVLDVRVTASADGCPF